MAAKKKTTIRTAHCSLQAVFLELAGEVTRGGGFPNPCGHDPSFILKQDIRTMQRTEIDAFFGVPCAEGDDVSLQVRAVPAGFMLAGKPVYEVHVGVNHCGSRRSAASAVAFAVALRRAAETACAVQTAVAGRLFFLEKDMPKSGKTSWTR